MQPGVVIRDELAVDDQILEGKRHRCSFVMGYVRLCPVAPIYGDRRIARNGVSKLRQFRLPIQIPHIKLPGPKEHTVLNKSHGNVTHECRQQFNQALRTVQRRRELAFDEQRRWLSLDLHTLPTP